MHAPREKIPRGCWGKEVAAAVLPSDFASLAHAGSEGPKSGIPLNRAVEQKQWAAALATCSRRRQQVQRRGKHNLNTPAALAVGWAPNIVDSKIWVRFEGVQVGTDADANIEVGRLQPAAQLRLVIVRVTKTLLTCQRCQWAGTAPGLHAYGTQRCGQALPPAPAEIATNAGRRRAEGSREWRWRQHEARLA